MKDRTINSIVQFTTLEKLKLSMCIGCLYNGTRIAGT